MGLPKTKDAAGTVERRPVLGPRGLLLASLPLRERRPKMRIGRLIFVVGSLVVALHATESLAQTVSCTGVPSYNATVVYNPGNRVVHNGKLYQANVPIWNTPPDYCPSCGWWSLIGTCGTGGGDTTPPSVPTGLSAPAKTSTSVSLAWNPSIDNPGGSGVAGYDVYRGGALAGSPTATSFTASGLSPATAYSFTVRARDNAGNASAQSAPLSVTTNAPAACNTLPSVPTGLNSPARTTPPSASRGTRPLRARTARSSTASSAGECRSCRSRARATRWAG